MKLTLKRDLPLLLAALAGVFYKIKSRGGSLRKKAGKKK